MSNIPRTSLAQQNLPTSAVPNQTNLDAELIKTLDLVISIKDNIHTVLENIGKCSNLNKTNNEPQNTLSDSSGITQAKTDESSEDVTGLDSLQQLFHKETDTKYLQDKAIELNSKLSQLELALNSLQTIQLNVNSEFISLLVDQNDEKSTLNVSKTMYNYRWLQSLQEKFGYSANSISNIPYKRFLTPYSEKKSSKCKFYKPIQIMNDFEKHLQMFMNSPLSQQQIGSQQQIKLNLRFIDEKQYIADIIMPHYFKFILYLFEYNIERIQVKPIDLRAINRLDVNEDLERKNNVSLFEKLEDNCAYAYSYYRSTNENSLYSLKLFLQWIKYYTTVFSAKCLKCERHLCNGMPPLWRDLKTYEIYHDECRS